MNKIGTLNIIKAYLGIKELTANNAYFGEYPLINGAPIIDDRLRFEALEDNTVIGLVKKSTSYNILQYSLDGDNWTDLTTSTSITLNIGDEMFIRGHMNANGGNNNYNNFKATSGAAAIKGNIMHLYDYEHPELKTISYSYAFRRLFYESSYLEDASELMLPATTLSNYCYSGMFSTSSIEVAPQLPATTLASYCYYYLFENCSSLISAPELPATTLALNCYIGMFKGCSSLTSAPELPATTLALNCYLYMFLNCSSLTSAPELPATTLASYCYSYMFLNCTALTSAPELPATTLASSCYNNMFNGCTNLNYIKCLATDITASGALTNWTNGVAANGTFDRANIRWNAGNNGIPEGWTVTPSNLTNYLTITTTGNNKIYLFNMNNSPDVKYSLDNGTTWTLWDYSDIILNDGDSVCFKGNNLNGFNTRDTYSVFAQSGSGSVNISGDVFSLIDENIGLMRTIPNDWCFYNIFGRANNRQLNIIDASLLNLSAITLKTGCYGLMFISLTNLTSVPELPATTLASSCYYRMFENCTSLSSAQTKLPATTLYSNCYLKMFEGCTSLTTAPELPATSLNSSCYGNMFYGCSSLSYIKCLARYITAEYCTSGWVNGVAANGTFIKYSTMTSWTTGNNGIPSGWTVQDA